MVLWSNSSSFLIYAAPFRLHPSSISGIRLIVTKYGKKLYKSCVVVWACLHVCMYYIWRAYVYYSHVVVTTGDSVHGCGFCWQCLSGLLVSWSGGYNRCHGTTGGEIMHTRVHIMFKVCACVYFDTYVCMLVVWNMMAHFALSLISRLHHILIQVQDDDFVYLKSKLFAYKFCYRKTSHQCFD